MPCLGHRKDMVLHKFLFSQQKWLTYNECAGSFILIYL